LMDSRFRVTDLGFSLKVTKS